MIHANKLTPSERKVLAIIGGILPSGVMGKDKMRLIAEDLAHDGIYMVRNPGGAARLTCLDVENMTRATAKNNHYSKWAEEKRAGAGQKMANILNQGGTKAGYRFLRDLGVA